MKDVFLIFDKQLEQTAKTNVDTQLLRNTWIKKLDDLFSMATLMAQGGGKSQQVGDKPKIIAPKERQLWGHVAAHTAEVMGNLAKGFDERQFNEDLAELEELVDEIKSFKLKELRKEINQQKENLPTKAVKQASKTLVIPTTLLFLRGISLVLMQRIIRRVFFGTRVSGLWFVGAGRLEKLRASR